MQLVSLDLDRGSYATKLHVGPFSSGLNVICGPARSGKSALAALIRQLVSHRAPDIHDSFKNVAGSLHYQDHRGNYRLTKNESNARPPRIEFRPHSHDTRYAGSPSSPYYPSFSSPKVDSTLSPYTPHPTINSRSLSKLVPCRLGETPIENLLDTAKELDVFSTTMRVADPGYESLRVEEVELKDRLRRANYLNHDRAWWENERQRILDRLSGDRSLFERSIHDRSGSLRPVLDRSELSSPWSDGRRLEEQIVSLQSEIDRLRSQEEDLLHTIRDREDQIEHWERERFQQDEQVPSDLMVDTRRKQLEEIDNRLYQWRQTLREIRDHRNQLQNNADDLNLDRQMDLGHPFNDNPRHGLTSLEHQIRSTQNQLDDVLSRYHSIDTRIGESKPFENAQFSHTLSSTLQSMQAGIHEVCQQLTRSDTKQLASQLKSQIEQLRRSETELLGSIERLIEERGELLRRIAEEYQIPFDRLSLAVGDWCQCHDHPHLYEWLLSERFPARHSQDASIEERLEQLRRELVTFQDELLRTRTRLEDLLRDIHAAELELKSLRARSAPRTIYSATLTPSEKADLVRRLGRADEALALWNKHHEWTLRLTRVQDELRRRNPYREESHSPLLDTADRYLVELTGRTGFANSWRSLRDANDTRDVRAWGDRAIDPMFDSRNPLQELALRMAIADAIAPKHGRVPLIIDNALEGMHGLDLDRVIQTLDRFTKNGQQIILLTADEEVASRVRAHRGWVCHLKNEEPIARSFVQERPAMAWDTDAINRQLTGYANEYQSEAWSTIEPARRSVASRAIQQPVPLHSGKQYFLSERSWIEEAPGIDASTAARLRGLGIVDVGGLLNADADSLARSLGMHGVDANDVRDWKAQAALMCQVPQLRAFDARLLVGSGIRNTKALAEMHPGRLLQQVQAFLDTDRGQNILRSGNPYELSRITSWIGSARSGQPTRTSVVDNNDYARNGAFNQIAPTERDEHRADRESYPRTNREARTDRSPRPERAARPPRQDRLDRQERADRADRTDRPERKTERVERTDRPEQGERSRVVRMNAVRTETNAPLAAGLKFYLELESPIVDAPSIGDRKAEQLNAIGIHTVAEFLASDPMKVAEGLGERRVTADVIETWQNQSRLMCSIPNLRGHDAQLLVAASFTDSQQMLAVTASEMLTRISRVASSKEGLRFLRGSTAPDLAEIQDWQSWAKHSRTIRAA